VLVNPCYSQDFWRSRNEVCTLRHIYVPRGRHGNRMNFIGNRNIFMRFFCINLIYLGIPWIVIGISVGDILRKQELGCWNHSQWWYTRWAIYATIVVTDSRR